MSVDALHDPRAIYIPDRNQLVDPKTGLATREHAGWLRSITQNVNTQPDTLADLHANRAAVDVSLFNTGTQYYETDRCVTYVLLGSDWAYSTGYMRDTVAHQPSDLGVHDAGFLFYVTDFHHLMEWTGTEWQFGPGDDGSGFFRDFVAAPTPIAGWTLCDGRATAYLFPAGPIISFGPIVTPNLSGNPSYRKSGAAYSAVLATGGGALTGGGAVDVKHITVLPYFRR